jgi:ATP-dependent Lon protease
VALQAHVGVPEGTVEEEYARNGFSGHYAHLYRREAPVAWTRIEGPLRPRAYDLNRLESPSVGGDLLSIEVTVMPGKGELALTGKLGDVMQESARAALSYARSRATELGIDPDVFDKNNIHVHVPAGAIPKDGPSAGITMATALISALTGVKVRRDVAMTGEITLRGKVLPIGGLREKTLAAHQGGIKTFILPSKNAKDLDELPDVVKADIELVQASTLDEVLAIALVREPDVSPQAEPSSGKRGRTRKPTADQTRHTPLDAPGSGEPLPASMTT